MKSLIAVLALTLALPPLAALAAEQANLDAGRKSVARGQFDNAIEQLERAIVADPRNPEGFMLLGESHRRQGRLTAALKYLNIALELEPNHLEALRSKGDVLLAQGEREEAEAVLQHLRQRCGDCREYRRLRQKVAQAGNG